MAMCWGGGNAMHTLNQVHAFAAYLLHGGAAASVLCISVTVIHSTVNIFFMLTIIF